MQLPNGQLQSRQRRPLPVNHLNVSYFAKFPAVSMEAMQYLLAEYTDRSLRLLGSLVEPPGSGCLLDAQADLTAANLAPSINSESPGTVPSQGLSDRSKALMECLVRIVNEIACFNQQNLSRSHGK